VRTAQGLSHEIRTRTLAHRFCFSFSLITLDIGNVQ